MLEDLTSDLLMAMESIFMETFKLEWPESEPRPDDFILGPADGRDGKHEISAKI